MNWLLSLLAAVAVGALMAALAARKGYSPLIWFFTVGLMIPGLIVLAFLPHVNKGELAPEEAARKRRRGNLLGGVVAAVGIGFQLLLIAASMYIETTA